jgi:hypothetical protein
VVAVAEPGQACHDVDRVAALLHEVARPLDPKRLDRLGRGLTGLRLEGAAELPRAQTRRLGKLGDGQRSVQIVPRISQRRLNSIGLWREFQERRNLRLAAGATMIDDELARDRLGDVSAKVTLDQR